MIKIVKSAKNVRLEGRAEKNGVAFRAIKFPAPLFGEPPEMLATVQEDGSIDCKLASCDSSIDLKIYKFAKRVCIIASILGALFFVAHIALTIAERAYGNVFLYLFYCMLASAIFIPEGVAILLARVFGDKDIQSFSKFSAAKNAVANAYYDLGRIPNIDEVKAYPIISDSSKYLKSVNAASATLLLTCGLALSLPGYWWILAYVVLAIAVYIFSKKGLLFFWQFIVVSKPDDIHYKTAIRALQEAVDFTDFLEMYFVPVEGAILLSHFLNGLNFSEEKCKSCKLYEFCKTISSHSSNAKIQDDNCSNKE